MEEKRKTITISREIYDGLKVFPPGDRQVIMDCIFETLFDGKAPPNNLTPEQKLAVVVYTPMLRKLQQKFLNGKSPKVFSRASEISETQAKRSEIQAKRSGRESNILYNTNKSIDYNNKQTNITITEDELKKREFYIEVALEKAKQMFGAEQQTTLQTLTKLLNRVRNEKSEFNIGGAIVKPSAWLERFIDVFRLNSAQVDELLNEPFMILNMPEKKITNKYRYWVAKIYNQLCEFGG